MRGGAGLPTDDARRIYGRRMALAPPLGARWYSPERVNVMLDWPGGQFPLEVSRGLLSVVHGGLILADTPGGRDELRRLVDPRLADIVDSLEPFHMPFAHTWSFRGGIYTGGGPGVETLNTVMRLRDEAGDIVGNVWISKPAVGMAVLTRISAMGDLGHFERMERVAKSGRRAAAVLFADLESSSPLSRRLSTASYFTLVRRLARAADQCVVDAGGLVGSHAGDGIVAFFLAETSARSQLRRTRASQLRARCAQRPMLSLRGVTCRRRIWSCVLGCIGEPTCTSARSRPADEPRSRRSATKSTRQPASRPALPAAALWRPKTSLNDSRPTTRPLWTWIPITSPIRRSVTSRRQPRRPGATRPRSRSATSDVAPALHVSESAGLTAAFA